MLMWVIFICLSGTCALTYHFWFWWNWLICPVSTFLEFFSQSKNSSVLLISWINCKKTAGCPLFRWLKPGLDWSFTVLSCFPCQFQVPALKTHPCVKNHYLTNILHSRFPFCDSMGVSAYVPLSPLSPPSHTAPNEETGTEKANILLRTTC